MITITQHLIALFTLFGGTDGTTSNPIPPPVEEIIIVDHETL